MQSMMSCSNTITSINELLPVAWHPNRWWDWCLDEEEKEVAEKLWRP